MPSARYWIYNGGTFLDVQAVTDADISDEERDRSASYKIHRSYCGGLQ